MSLFYVEPELVVAHGRKVLFLNPNDLQIFKDIELPTDLTTCGLKPTANEAGEEPSSPKGDVSILNVSYSPDRQLIAVTTAGQKALLLYKSRPEHAKLLSIRPLSRASSALRFAPDSTSLLVTDKTGDCYQFDCNADVEAPPKLILGHLSIVYDILWTADLRHIISCDRDDKIRVTNYPASYDIHSYCLGHKEFVAGLALLGDQQQLVSVSGDKTLRIWNYASGEELLQHTLPAPAVRLQLLELVPGQRYQAAVLFYDHSAAVGLYELQQSTTDAQWSVQREQLIEADAGNWHIGNFALCDQRIYVMGLLQDNSWTLRAYNSQTGEEDKTLPDGWLSMVVEQFAGQAPSVPEDLSVWFKKRYDNVSDYMERKKRRIEDTSKPPK
ncbi:hypothetical protein KR093_006501 [Drosophila rubida]|uniref:tRNA (guanine-N(7)-)-methyltransferase non-catalytic subunit wuho n=1 Tax=Drosophila rubida TaxID=30044 RepID=A0AAD4KDG0_9MUSC|nr:hypothetical protein KR093_006501 [Drosophila rubida]